MITVTPDPSAESGEAQHARIARFQIGLVDIDDKADVFVSLMACLIEAHTTVTQVLVFRFRTENASFKADSARVSINRENLEQLLPTIQTKVRAYQTDYVSSIKDL